MFSLFEQASPGKDCPRSQPCKVDGCQLSRTPSWTVIGKTSRSFGKRLHLVMHSFFSKGPHINKATGICCGVNSTPRKFWEIEDYGTEIKRSDVMTMEEKVAIQKAEELLKHNGSRNSLAVPWKENCSTQANNRETGNETLGKYRKKFTNQR